MLVVNAANTAKDLDWVLSHNKFNASVQDITDRIALLAVQGPRAIDILQPLTPLSLEGVRYYHFVQAKIADRDAILSRTGYTGEDGFEIYFSPEHSEFIWSTLLKVGSSFGLLPAGLGARNTLRLEAKMLLYGNDMDNTTTLLEAGLGWIVKFNKDDFVGREALLRQKQEGIARKLAGFEMLGREIGREHYPVYVNGRESGYVTSGSPSITLGKNIGLAYLPVEHTIPGTKIQVAIRGRMCDAQVVPTPFYKRREHA
jgi:aminomethyltransferase